MTFKAHVCIRCGDYRDLVVQHCLPVDPGPSEILIRDRAFAVGFPDLLTIQGKYQRKPNPPFVLGSEFCGQVVEIGDQVSQFKQGDAVMGSVLLEPTPSGL